MKTKHIGFPTLLSQTQQLSKALQTELETVRATWDQIYQATAFEDQLLEELTQTTKF
jgi:hypothetical protein